MAWLFRTGTRAGAKRIAQGLGLGLAVLWTTQSCKTPAEHYECSEDSQCNFAAGKCHQGACFYRDDSCPEKWRSHGQCTSDPDAGADAGSGGANGDGGDGGSGNGGSSGAGSGGKGGDGGGSSGSPGTGNKPGTDPEGGTGELTVAAGAIGGKGTIDGTGSFARFISPACLAFDGDHYIYVGDAYGHTIRRLDLETEEVTTIAGYPYVTGNQDGNGSDARFANPECVAYDGTDPNNPALYVAEWQGHRIRKVALNAAYSVSTVAGSPDWESGLVDGVGALAKFHAPVGMVRRGNLLYVADSDNHAIRTINLDTSAVSTLIGDLVGAAPGNVDGPVATARLEVPHGLALDSAGNRLFIGEFTKGRVRVLDLVANTVSTVIPSGLGGPASLAYDTANGTLIAPLFTANEIVRIDVAAKTFGVLSGSGEPGSADGPPSTASFHEPHGVVIAPDNTLFVADFSGPIIRKLVPNGSGAYQTSTIAGLAAQQGLRDATGEAARFWSPGDMALAPDKRTSYVLDGPANCAVRTFDLVTKEVTTVTGGECIRPEGAGPAARFNDPVAMTMGVAAQGAAPQLFVTDVKGLVRKVDTANGNVTTLNPSDAEKDPELHTWRGIAATATTLYVSDEFERKIFQMPVAGGSVSDYAGTGSEGCSDAPAASSTFKRPQGLLWDGTTKLYVADSECQTIRRIDLSNNTVQTVAGGNKEGDEDPDGTGEDAAFGYPVSLNWDRAKKGFYVEDVHTVRWVDATTFEVKTIAGDKDDHGAVWLSPNPVRLNHPGGFIEGADGELYITSDGAILQWVAPP